MVRSLVATIASERTMPEVSLASPAHSLAGEAFLLPPLYNAATRANRSVAPSF
jgi:hypothetical protein